MVRPRQRTRSLLAGCCLLALLALLASHSVQAQAGGGVNPLPKDRAHKDSLLPAVDRASEEEASRPLRPPLPHQQAARARLAAAVPSISVTWHPGRGTPAMIHAGSGLPVAERGTSAAMARGFFKRNCDLFDACSGVTLSTEGLERFEPRGTSRVLLRQIVDGRELYRAGLSATIDSQGRLMSVTSHVISGLKSGPASRLAEEEMIERALGFAGAGGRDDLRITTREIAYPWKGVAWPALLVWIRGPGDLNYKIAVDAVRGDLLMRAPMVFYDGVPTAQAKVFLRAPNDLGDSPANPPVQPTVVSLAGDPVASPFNWVSEVAGGPETTAGNNVAEARYFTFLSPPRIPTDEGGEFMFEWSRAYTDCTIQNYAFRVQQCHDLSDDPLLAATNLFFHANRMHDLLFDLGFTEAWGNFQQVNFQNEGGLDGDAIFMSSVSNGYGLSCNARYLAAPDGFPPEIEMGLFHPGCGPAGTQFVDSSLDPDVIYHEYGHGLSTRIVGEDNMQTNTSAGLMGEGWGDFLAAHLLSHPGAPGSEADPAGPYRYGEYEINGGGRRYPMATSMTLNPLTFAELCDGGTCEVHDDGEIWANVLWETRFNILQDHGFNPGHEIMGRLLVESMKNLIAGPPDMILGRDALLAADSELYEGVNCTSIWQAFAKRGLGPFAAFGNPGKTIPIPDFDPPPDDNEDGVFDRCEPVSGGGGGGCGEDGCHDFGLK